MTIIKHTESVEVKTFKENQENAELFNPIKPRKVHKKEGT